MVKKMSAPQNIGSEEESQNPPDPGDGREPHGTTAPPSKSEAVRLALAAGFEGPQKGTAYIRKAFGIEITPSLFLAVKATERKRNWTRNGKPGRKPKHAAEAGQATTPHEQQADGEGDPIE